MRRKACKHENAINTHTAMPTQMQMMTPMNQPSSSWTLESRFMPNIPVT